MNQRLLTSLFFIAPPPSQDVSDNSTRQPIERL